MTIHFTDFLSAEKIYEMNLHSILLKQITSSTAYQWESLKLDQGLNFLLDAPLVTKFNFHSTPNKFIWYCQRFSLTLCHDEKGADFMNIFAFKNFFFTKYRKVIINGILKTPTLIYIYIYIYIWYYWNWLNK